MKTLVRSAAGLKMKMSIIILSLLLTIGTTNCTEDILTEPIVESEMVVVSAFLFAGEKIEKIQLTKTFPLGSEDTVAVPINDAQVYLTKNGKDYLLKNKPDQNGYYFYDGNDLKVESGDMFYLRVNYNNQTITAATVVPTKPAQVSISKQTLILTSVTQGMGGVIQDTNSIKVSWGNPDSSLYYIVIQNLETNPTLIPVTSTRGGSMKVTFPPNTTSEFLIARRNLTYLGQHVAIVYKVNQEYADLYESRTQSSKNLNEPISNIKNGLGVFSAFASDAVNFNVISQ